MVWATGMTLLTLCYSMRGLSAVAAYSISSTVVNVFNIAYMALGNSVGIIVGKYLGAGDVETAQDVDNKMIAFSVMTGLVLGALLAATSWLFPMAYNVSDEAKRIAASFLLITGCLMPLHGFCTVATSRCVAVAKRLLHFCTTACLCAWSTCRLPLPLSN